MKKIGELLVEHGIISNYDLEMALEQQKSMTERKPLGEILVEMKIINIDSLLKFLEIQLREKFNNMEKV
jgi:hypothetical protein